MKKDIKFMKSAMWGLILLAVVLFNSCSKTTSIAPDYSTLFPQTVGNFWEYAIHDSVKGFFDTALVTIEGTTTLPSGQTAYVWRYHYHYKGYSDTTYVVLQGTTAIVYINASPSNVAPNYVEYERFTSPEGLGQSTTANGDTMFVERSLAINVPAGNFSPCYEIIHNTSNPGYQVYDKIVFYNEIGQVHFSHWTSGSNFNNFLENGDWSLLSYNLTK